MNHETDEHSTASVPPPDRPPRAKGHKEGCSCRMCERIRQMHTRSLEKPPDKRRTGAKDLKRRRFVQALTSPGTETFASPSKSAVAAGYSPASGDNLLRQKQVQSLIEAALSRAGISDDILAQVAREGLDATVTRFFADKGKVTDERTVKDWHAIHKFLSLLFSVKGYLGRDADGGQGSGGGLNIIRSNVQIVTPGHPDRCGCDSCIERWNEAADTRLEEHERKLRENLGPEWFANSKPEGGPHIKDGEPTARSNDQPPPPLTFGDPIPADPIVRDDQGRPMYDLRDPYDRMLYEKEKMQASAAKTSE